MKRFLILIGATLFLMVFVTVNPISVQAATFVLEGDYLRTGVSDSGGLIDDSFVVGIDYDDTGTSTWTTYDFLKPGSPFEFYSMGYDSAYDTAGYSSGNAFSATSTNTSSGSVNSATTTGSYGSLNLEQYLSYNDDSGFIDFHVKITNSSDTAVNDVVYARGLDPDQDVYAGGGYSTTNVIASGDLVYAAAPVTDWTIAIFSDSSYTHVPSIDAPWNTNPYDLLIPHDDGDGDYAINMAFDIGTLAAGEYADIYFEYRIAETSGGVDPGPGPPSIPEPATMLLLGSGLIGLVGFRRKKLFKE